MFSNIHLFYKIYNQNPITKSTTAHFVVQEDNSLPTTIKTIK